MVQGKAGDRQEDNHKKHGQANSAMPAQVKNNGFFYVQGMPIDQPGFAQSGYDNTKRELLPYLLPTQTESHQ